MALSDKLISVRFNPENMSTVTSMATTQGLPLGAFVRNCVEAYLGLPPSVPTVTGTYVYQQTERATTDTPGLWTVGYYDPTGEWVAESDHASAQAASQRVAWLNGADNG